MKETLNKWICRLRGIECKPNNILECFKCIYENIPIVTSTVNKLVSEWTNFDIKEHIKVAKEKIKDIMNIKK